MPRVVLAYTGGLATSLCIHYLRMKKGLDVVTFTANVGQPVSLEPICERAIELGAQAAHISDLRERFAADFAFSALRAGAVYESGYYLGKALTRPLFVEEMARIAAEDRCEYLAHGCSGRGNERIRFEAAAAAVAPGKKMLAPLEEWGLTTRDEQKRYAARYNMELELEADELAPVDQNLWGIGRAPDASLIDTWTPLPESLYRLTVAPEKAPDEPLDLELGFKLGVPVRLDGRSVSAVQVIEDLNALGGRHGVGRRDTIEDRISGVKTREIYEAPAAAILYSAHAALEHLVMSKELLNLKRTLARRYAELVYDGLWFSETREGLDAFFRRVSRTVTGDVRVRLWKGGVHVRGVRSPFSLYDQRLARSAAECSEEESVRGIRESEGYALGLPLESAEGTRRRPGADVTGGVAGDRPRAAAGPQGEELA